jgi:hypothetical protein
MCLPCLFYKISLLISSALSWKTNLFFLVLCAIEKSIDSLVYLLKSCSFGSLLSPSWFYVLLEWDKSLSMCVLLNLLCLMVFTLFFFELSWTNLMLICFFDIIWTPNLFCHNRLCLLVFIGVLYKFYLVWIF